ncbi:MAG: HAMP domain-containing protein [Tepidisphaeraceae bacterium]|jgi:methyl-accepting chemotaxis protein
MLRRKLLVLFGALVALLVVTGVGAVWVFQQRLGDLRHMDEQVWAATDEAADLALTISNVEIQLFAIEAGQQQRLDPVLDALEAMQQRLDAMSRFSLSRESENASLLAAMRERMGTFRQHVAGLATSRDGTWAARHRKDALSDIVNMRVNTLAFSRNLRAHASEEQGQLIRHFRQALLVLAVVFIVLINLSVLTLLRMASMVVGPVDRLVEATRELARERFDYRVDLQRHDEFGELAVAFNGLAERLEENERKKLESVHQLAIALNHELNTVATMISLQAQLIGRQAGGNPVLEKYTRQIQESLGRMSRTMEAIKHLKRIVLTEYTQGVKMLDIERSSAEHDNEDGPHDPEQAVTT